MEHDRADYTWTEFAARNCRGIAVGGGVIALFIVLDMVPRLAQLTSSYDKVHWYEGAMIGVLCLAL